MTSLLPLKISPTKRSLKQINAGWAYESVLAHAWDGKQACKSVAAILHDLLSAEYTQGKTMKKILRSHHLPKESEDGSSLSSAMELLRDFFQMHHSDVSLEFYDKGKAANDAYVAVRHEQSHVASAMPPTPSQEKLSRMP